MPSYLETQFAQIWDYYHPDIDLKSEYLFAPPRKYRFDFASPLSLVAIEIQGGIWQKKRTGHSSGKGIERDCEKFSLGASKGWLIFPLSERMITEKWTHIIAETIHERLSIQTAQKPQSPSQRNEMQGCFTSSKAMPLGLPKRERS